MHKVQLEKIWEMLWPMCSGDIMIEHRVKCLITVVAVIIVIATDLSTSIE